MTTELATPPVPKKQRRKGRAPGAVAIWATRLVLFWERLWPAVLPALSIPYAIIVISLFDLWRFAPAWLHWISLTLAAAAFLNMLWRDARHLRFPSRRMAQARLEEDGKVKHAPLQALDDLPFQSSNINNPLWRAHMRDSRKRARNARLGGMRPTADDKDPYALRFTALGLLAVALVAAGEDWRDRLQTALAPGQAEAAGRLVADIWIEPPDYTGKAPIYLMRPGDEIAELASQVNAPEGSILVAQINGRGRPRLAFEGETEKTEAAFKRNAGASHAQLPLTRSGLLKLQLGGSQHRWPIAVISDEAPRVRFAKTPTETDEGLLAFAITAEDDYGVTATRFQFRLSSEQERPLDAPPFDEKALSAIRASDIDGIAGNIREHPVTLELQEDPWAGLSVLAKIVVTDGAGQTGETEEVLVTLPERVFFNPLAKAVIEQRQTLSVAAEDWRRVGRSFDAVTLAPEAFYVEDPTDFLMLRAAFWRVMRQDGDDFDDAIEKFWPLALQLEDEALELARQRLEAAEEALRQALENGASDEEINRLVEELRQAMNDYLTALAQSGQRADPARAQNSQQLDKSDLDQMLDSIRDLAQSGAENAARQMLSDLQNMLNNLRLSQGGQGGGQGMPGQSGQSGESDDNAAGRAGELIGRQRSLADESFERGQSGAAPSDDLAQEQGDLASDLNELLDDLQGDEGADPNGDGARSFNRARNNMRDAEQALQSGDFDAAEGAMERAIENLREGAEELAREQMRQAGEGRQNENGAPVDPLGRPIGRAGGEGVDVPEETDAGRTRAVIEELRRRLGEPGRSQEEIDYLERLLERF
ncbi:Methyl-accepting chemotaxis protein [Durusdinium trenchii]|uniref:Methyl-accepting chemotaxis protein n=1 Tax=Durusdinium trenchii TaxID=1381693 RepID=A0ABP0LK00_9DINO